MNSMSYIIITLFIIIISVTLYGVSYISTDIDPVVNITYYNWTLNSTECSYHNETLGSYSVGHGDGICTHSAFYCDMCNCSARTERWCDNETKELERLREKYGDDVK